MNYLGNPKDMAVRDTEEQDITVGTLGDPER